MRKWHEEVRDDEGIASAFMMGGDEGVRRGVKGDGCRGMELRIGSRGYMMKRGGGVAGLHYLVRVIRVNE